jgi:hypothetical protein
MSILIPHRLCLVTSQNGPEHIRATNEQSSIATSPSPPSYKDIFFVFLIVLCLRSRCLEFLALPINLLILYTLLISLRTPRALDIQGETEGRKGTW